MSESTTRACMHCKAPGAPARPLKNCGRCRMVASCGAECHMADWATHKVVCCRGNRGDLGYAGGDGNVVFQDPNNRLDDVYAAGAFVQLRMPPSRDFPAGMNIVLKLAPALVAELGELTAEERAAIDQLAIGAMRNPADEGDIMEMVAEAVKKAKEKRGVTVVEATAVDEESEEESEEDDDDNESEEEDEDESDEESEDGGKLGLWEQMGKVIAFKY